MIHQRTAFAMSTAILLFSACTAPPSTTTVVDRFQHPVLSIPAEADANIALVEGYLNALVRADAQAIRAAVAPGFYANNTFVPSDSSDVEAVIANWMRNDTTRSDQKVEKIFAQSIQIAEGNDYPGQWVQYWGKYSATDNATGKPFTVKFIYDANVRDGKLVKSYTWLDRLSTFHQLGTTPPPAPASLTVQK